MSKGKVGVTYSWARWQCSF